ncbi:hypothetical protein CgunFtcFv8_002324 [Champsocephalus gunnari]|uniref:Uncharacterized protein n=1 Tax=Champsocephalus gunnari TaxID=52237 RepID=A0AAN8HBE8_CHAGU|nr:hypothetical protein CgunFtcFv8_002324 [Champsocephalus gunnari]
MECLRPILGHLIQVRGFNIPVTVPAEAVKGDEQQLVGGALVWCSSTGRASTKAEDSKAEQQHDGGLSPETPLVNSV